MPLRRVLHGLRQARGPRARTRSDHGRATRAAAAVAMLPLWLLASSCVSHPSEHLYSVTGARQQTKAAEPQAGAAAMPMTGAGIAVRPVALPELIDRPQLVVRRSAHEVEVLENQRWAEALQDDLTRALIAALQDAGAPAVAADAPQAHETETTLEVAIGELISGPGPQVSLQATWVLRDHARAARRQGRLSETIPSAIDPAAIVESYGQAMRRLAASIVRSLRDGQL